MIKSFGDKETEKVLKGEFSSKLPNSIQRIARRKLRMINNSLDHNDLKIPPANHIEKLSGDYKGYYSVRINQQWSIVFQWKSGNALDARIVDDH